jgi:hypothetical protein
MEMSGQFRAPAALLPGKETGTCWIGGWMNLRAGLDAVAKGKYPFTDLTGKEIPVVQPVAWSLY